MRLIGAGLPRTGTLAQKIALELLGFEPCYHMVNVLADLDEAGRWQQALDGELPLPELLDDFEATVDWPGAFFYGALTELYPDAKVLLSVRDGDAWARSMRDTIWGVLYGDILIRHLSSARCTIDPQWRGYIGMMKEMWRHSGLMIDEDTSPEWMSRAMRRYNDEVRQTVPSDRLLVWSVTEGWEPLCEFLDLPVPDMPFPHVNDSKEFAERIVDGSLLAINARRSLKREAAAVI